jgi:hypothetical protein
LSFSSDYEDEMGRLGRLSDRELEQLAAGRTPSEDDALEELAGHLRSVRAACVQAPDEVTQALHLAEITQTAQLLAESREPMAAAAGKAIGPAVQASGPSKWRRRMEVARSITLKLTAGVAAAMLSTVGLAYAGVDLPGQAAEQAFDAVGVELPNQAEGEVEITSDGPDENADQTALDVWAVISTWLGERGCAFGQAVANAATDGEHPPDCTAAECAGSQGDEASAEGRATAGEASSDGTSTANEASGGASEAGTDTGDTASERGQSHNPSSGSESGEETGDTASETGQSNNPTDSGRP